MSSKQATVTTQPFAHPEPQHISTSHELSNDGATPTTSWTRSPGLHARHVARKLTTRHAWLGDYQFGALCLPRLLPWKPDSKLNGGAAESPFYGVHDELPIAVAAICGLQHALAMLGGLITPPMIIASSLSLSAETSAYLISASLITSGLISAVQQSAIPLPFMGGRQLGTGLLSVVGTSFTTLSVTSSVFTNLYAEGVCPLNPDGSRAACPDAYGYLLGTAAVCALLEIALSFLPVKVLKRMWPPLITGTLVFFVGIKLIGESAIPSFGGGSSCHGTTKLCSGTDHRAYLWGDAHYLGLGLLAFLTVVVTEIFGSPAMRNASIAIGLLFPLVVAGPLGYMSSAPIESARPITFLWVETFQLRVYGPAVLPLLAVYISLMMECIGDVTATSEVSRVEVDGVAYDRRISGGVLVDGLAGIFSALFTVPPLSVFAQNNGVIAITKCANIQAGRWCSFWLILFGIIGKLAGCVRAIPQPVLGGVLLILFGSIAVSGIKILQCVTFTRRNRFILALSFGFGFGTLLVHDLFSNLFTYKGGNKALSGFLDSIIIVISTPFLISAVVGMIANGILPMDEEDRQLQRARESPQLAPNSASDEKLPA
ncbi:putative purine permease [Mycosarcoma maydis]|uniref:Purine permease n=1 Tax=Mycosarcoma maydis TaxID=5270 RepID=A0A0D1EBC3_MYCMD|nr:putative purine permease [Ustilago maydis 521]KIS71635.1 putative purine permease [Ustilago maydis 521]|eukprot:XP_011386043.1 putative purine permease [Ustilago maydis 521]